jgi:hypothetical protein
VRAGAFCGAGGRLESDGHHSGSGRGAPADQPNGPSMIARCEIASPITADVERCNRQPSGYSSL